MKRFLWLIKSNLSSYSHCCNLHKSLAKHKIFQYLQIKKLWNIQGTMCSVRWIELSLIKRMPVIFQCMLVNFLYFLPTFWKDPVPKHVQKFWHCVLIYLPACKSIDRSVVSLLRGDQIFNQAFALSPNFRSVFLVNNYWMATYAVNNVLLEVFRKQTLILSTHLAAI